MYLLKNTLLLERQMIKVSVIPLESTNESNFPEDDRFKELQLSFKDLHPEVHQPKVKEEHHYYWGFNNKKCQWKGCVSR